MTHACPPRSLRRKPGKVLGSTVPRPTREPRRAVILLGSAIGVGTGVWLLLTSLWAQLLESLGIAGEPLAALRAAWAPLLDIRMPKLSGFEVLVARGARHCKAERLKELAAALDPQRFVRIHRFYLLNVERLARLELYAKDSWIAILTDGTKLPVSRAGYARLRELL